MDQLVEFKKVVRPVRCFFRDCSQRAIKDKVIVEHGLKFGFCESHSVAISRYIHQGGFKP